MPPLMLSSMLGDLDALSLNEFKAKFHILVQHKPYSWESALSELMNIALQSQGPDVSQISTTWLGSLTGMIALRLFRESEVELFGGKQAFLPSAWEGATLLGVDDIYAIPWITDVHLLAFRRDMLENARIDEGRAFINAESFEETLAKLILSGVKIPLAMSTVDDVLYNLVSWVWGAGGSFRTENHRHLTLTDPKTITGIRQYFQLHRYLAPGSRSLSTAQATDLFVQGKAAIALTTYANIKNHIQRSSAPINLETISLAPVPGVPFIGGSSLVIWLHSYQEDSALKLVQHLVSSEVQKSIFLNTGELPTRAELFTTKPFTTDRFLQTVAHSLRAGRAFQSSRKWAVIEIRLNPALSIIWDELFESPDFNLNRDIAQRFADVQKSIEQSLLRTHPLF
jgi:ABC-type glycerol-3-phosphate transport system substrate-binding protein